VALKSKAPPYSPHRDNPHDGDNVGMRITDRRTGRSLFYAPGLGEIEPHLRPLLEQADAVMVDGTFWTDDEMIQLGISQKRARDIGHLPQSGAGGMIEVLKPLQAQRKVLIHINNTNPILDEDSPQRAQLKAAGIEVAYDGMGLEI
jgi:pyrroloquinoline quinone biosynthesis protein B